MNPAEIESGRYTVVARRYRPQTFGDLVGQNHISHALGNAIKHNRVGHAYLFTGARGVGKTSSARIFAKCLNCEQGPTDQPCNVCDICRAISIGEDIDVLEIDGASNRGIDEIRQLRTNAIVRPSRSKYKIYIIDEVHMLTQQAFNALLKTLEEPPEHVKFIFCTTDPQKIPITVLSRCQRFDFSPVQATEIVSRLTEICDSEQIQYDVAALALLARRAGGSMRDSQSLLEQLLSFCTEKITVEDVHRLLGTADTRRIEELVAVMGQKQTGSALEQIATAVESGVDPGQLATQLLGYFRDLMAVAVGASQETLLTCDPESYDELGTTSQAFGLETILAAIQILDHCVSRMQTSLHGRTSLEVAAVRICHLEKLNLVADLVDQLASDSEKSTQGRSGAIKKNSRAAENSELTARRSGEDFVPIARPDVASEDNTAKAVGPATVVLDAKSAEAVWQQVAKQLGGVSADMASQYDSVSFDDDCLQIVLRDKHVLDFCSRNDRLRAFENKLKLITGHDARLTFSVRTPPSNQPAAVKAPKLTRVQMLRKLEQNEFVKDAIDLFDAEVTEFRHPRNRK